MKKSEYWTVKLTHAKQAYNDENTYAIVNGDGKVIASFYGSRADELITIANAHNACFLEEEKPE